MTFSVPEGALRSVQGIFCIEAVFLSCFTLLILGTPSKSNIARTTGLVNLCALTLLMEKLLVPLCLRIDRPHWAATGASLFWVQLFSASELILASRVNGSQLRQSHGGMFGAAMEAVGLLWNMRRIGTVWQVKNVPIVVTKRSRARFVLERVTVTVVAYLLVDAVVSMPPPEQSMVTAEKATLFSLWKLDIGDIIFRSATTAGCWLITGVLNLFMTNVGAITAVTLGLSSPEECRPLYGSFSEAYTIRRFWGVSWHQMFRSFLTGHANLIVDHTLPFVPRHSVVARYTRLTLAFLISGLIHARADQLMGVPMAENGAVLFFLLHAVFIMLEDTLAPLARELLPRRARYIVGYFWVFFFFAWSSPVWIYANMRLGLSSASLLPVRVVGKYMVPT